MSLDALIPEPRRVALRGLSVEFLPLKMRQVPGFLRAIAPIMSLVQEERYADAVTENYAAVREAACIAAGVDGAVIDDLYPDDFITLVGAVMEVNLDFFVRRVLPLVQGQARVAMITALAGVKHLPGLSGADTASPNAST